MTELFSTSAPMFTATRPPEDAAARAFLAQLWGEIERLPPLQRRAYLLNFTDGAIGWFWLSGAASVRQIGQTLNLTNEQYNRLWVLLEWSDEQRARARLLTNTDEKFALLWQQLPLNDLTIAALLSTTQQNVWHLRQAARQQISRKLSRTVPLAPADARP